MEVIKERFENMKLFIKSSVKNEAGNDLLQKFYGAPVEWFIDNIKKKKNEGMTKEVVLTEIFEVFALKKEDYTAEQTEKCERYIAYFMEIADHCK